MYKIKTIMPNKIIRIIAALLLFFHLEIGFSSPAPQIEKTSGSKEDYIPSKVRLSAQGSTEGRGIYYIDYLLPLYYSKDQDLLLFFNTKETISSPHQEEQNLGVGVRRIFFDKYILGAHYFYDKKYSRKKKFYSQNGCGLEFLSEPFDFRFNYYDPTSKAKTVDDGYEFGGTHLIYTQSQEEPLEGFDFEIGLPVIPKKAKTRIYAGGFFYDSNLAKNVNGFRARTETDINKWLAIDTVLDSRNAGEIDFMGGIRITIPLELGRVLRKKNPFKTNPPSAYLKDRLFERVVRDIDVQSRSATKKEEQSDVEIIYVDNSNTSGPEDGTLAHPYTTLGQALIDSRYVGQGGSAKYIYVSSGDGSSYNGGISLAETAVLWGSGYNGGFKGLTASASNPVISGGGDVVTLGNHNTVMGLTLQDGNNGIYGANVSSNVIKHNTISNNTQNGIYLNHSSSSSGITISDNTISNNGSGGPLDDGIYINAGAGSTVSDYTISRNTISGNTQNGIKIRSDDGAVSGFNISNNDISLSTNGDGIQLQDNSSGGTCSMSDFAISGNTIYNNTNGNGINFDAYAYYYGTNTFSSFNISGNTITGNGNGVKLLSAYYYYGTNNFNDVDFGGGALSQGSNSIYSNTNFDMVSDSGSSISAENNYWGGAEPNLSGSDSVDYTPYLTDNPN